MLNFHMIPVIYILTDPTSYKRLIGCLLYLTITRPNLSYLVQVLSQLMDKPRSSHLDFANCVLRYVCQDFAWAGFILSHFMLPPIEGLL
jgi:hypothetical protein